MMYTYFAADPNSELVKIGRSSTPRARVSQQGLILIAVIEGNIEKALHARFADTRAHGEFFTRSDELNALIAEHSELPTNLDRVLMCRATEEMFARLETLAKADKRPVSYLVRVAVEQYLNRRKPAA